MSNLTSLQHLGPVRVLVEYEYTPGEKAEGPESRWAGPGSAANVVVTRVYIPSPVDDEGAWVDAEYFNADTVAEWESNILLEHHE